MVTGKGFVERTSDNALRFENMSIGPMGLGGSASKIFFRPQLQYHLVGPELNLKLAVPLKGGSVTELYQVVGTGIVYSTTPDNPNSQNNNSSGNNETTIKYKKPKSNISGKEGAKDVPSWAKGERAYTNENGDKFARRLLDKKYGKGNYSTKSQTEYSKIKKWGDRAFE
jgi:hypothetical protein